MENTQNFITNNCSLIKTEYCSCNKNGLCLASYDCFYKKTKIDKPIRDFKELINEIEIDGEKITPIKKIWH